jgi:hypothetical protein
MAKRKASDIEISYVNDLLSQAAGLFACGHPRAQ